MIIALSIALFVAAIIIVALVLFQDGKSKGLSGSIAGGAETFFGKDKGNKRQRLLNNVTTILSIAFCVVLIIMYVVQPDYKAITTPNSGIGNSQYQIGEDTEEAEETTTAPETDAESTPADTDADTGAETDGESAPADSETAEAPVL